LLHDAGHDRADGAPGARRVPDLLGGGAVVVLDGPPGSFQPAKEGVDAGDVALVQP
jgi:hypothetical protein